MEKLSYSILIEFYFFKLIEQKVIQLHFIIFISFIFLMLWRSRQKYHQKESIRYTNFNEFSDNLFWIFTRKKDTFKYTIGELDIITKFNTKKERQKVINLNSNYILNQGK